MSDFLNTIPTREKILAERVQALGDLDHCPVGMLRADGKCHFCGEKCRCLNNGTKGLGLEHCLVKDVLYAMADGEISVGGSRNY